VTSKFKESYDEFIGRDDGELETLKIRRDTRYHDLQAWIKYFEMDGYCTVHPELLWQALLDYFKDIAHLKERHGTTHAQVEKIYSYELFWYLRNHVIQITDYEKQLSDPLTSKFPNRLFANEYILSFWVMGCICSEMRRKIGFNIQHDDFLDKDAFLKNSTNDLGILEFHEKLFYTFRCRVYTQESLLLTFEAFKAGLEFMFNKDRILEND